MRLEKIDKFITDEATHAYKTLLQFWLYVLPVFLIVLIFLKFSSDLYPGHFYALAIYIIISFFLVSGIHHLLSTKPKSKLLFLAIYISGIAYPLFSPLFVFIATNVFAPDFSASIMTHTIPSLYLIMTMATGFSFSFRVSAASGILSSILFSVCFLWFKNTHPEAVEQELQIVGLSYFIEIVSYILITGLLGGLLANQARKMLGKIIDSVKEREFVTNILGEYVSEEVRDKILKEGGLDIEGEEREVTILFADLRDFTSISEDRKPQEIVSILNEYFDSMVEVIQRNGGVIDKFIGDSIMAYFGAPLSLDNPQKKAFQAANEMSSKLHSLNQILKSKNLPTLKQGIGLHHGIVVIGNIGSKTRKNYTIIGDAVNLASRLESLTKEIDQDLVWSESVHSMLDNSKNEEYVLLKGIKLKGKKQTISIYSFKNIE
jgi:class 3 adenylate cyclase